MSTSLLPPPLRWAVWLVTVEAVVAGLASVYFGYLGFAHEAASFADAFALTGYAALVAAALVGLAFALARRKARARAPAIVLQLLGVMAAVLMMTGAELFWLAVPIALAGVLVTTLLLAPSTSEALR